MSRKHESDLDRNSESASDYGPDAENEGDEDSGYG
jgi:hypothetical protein